MPIGRSVFIAIAIVLIIVAGVAGYFAGTSVAPTTTVTTTVTSTIAVTHTVTVTATTASPTPTIESSGSNRGLRLSRFITEGIDALFYCWIRRIVNIGGIVERFEGCRASGYWRYTFNQTSYTVFTESYYHKPKGIQTVSLRSKDTFRYGVFEIHTKLPIVKDGPFLWFGFELEDLFGGGVIHFQYITSSGQLVAFAGSSGALLQMDLTPFLPPNYAVEKHWYKIVVTEKYILYYINNRLRGIAILVAGDAQAASTVYNFAPYKIGVVKDIPSLALPILLDIDGAPHIDFKWPDFNPWDLRVSEGRPNPPIFIDLYQLYTDKKLSGTTISQRTISAPVPALGRKTLVFNAQGEGKLTIEVSNDGFEWISLEQFYIKDKTLVTWPNNSDYLLMRVVIEPLSSISVTEASVIIQ
ncbi:MAG: hypothetical protein QXK24_01190 [Ignisphaera sp.]